MIVQRDPVASCDVCKAEFEAIYEKADAISLGMPGHWRHPDHFYTVKWRDQMVKCCSNKCAISYVEGR
jgi:hypothetical protein